MKGFLNVTALAVILFGPAVIWAQSAAPITAVAEMNPTQGNTVQGEIKFIQEDGDVRVIAHVKGLTPGKHPFHVHEVGDCSAPDGSSAGGHFKPTETQSGPDGKTLDVADLGKLTANSKGTARYTFKDKLIHLSGPDSIIGRAVVIHASDSPARVACGVIQQLQDNK